MKYIFFYFLIIFSSNISILVSQEQDISVPYKDSHDIDTGNDEIDEFLINFLKKGGSQEALNDLHLVFATFISDNAKKDLYNDYSGSFIAITLKVIPVVLKMSNDDKLILWNMYRDKKKDVEDKTGKTIEVTSK